MFIIYILGVVIREHLLDLSSIISPMNAFLRSGHYPMLIVYPAARLSLYDCDWTSRGLARDVMKIPRVDVFLYLQLLQ